MSTTPAEPPAAPLPDLANADLNAELKGSALLFALAVGVTAGVAAACQLLTNLLA